MPSPVTPDQFTAVVPSPSADICQKIKLVFLQLPSLLAQLVDWMLDDDGNPSEEFITAVSPILPGMMMPTAGSSVPMGWLLCNGQAVSRTTYAALFAQIGTTWGVGDNSTTFNVPDGRDRSVIGASATRTLGTTGGAATVTLTEAQMPSHSHQVRTRADFVNGANSGALEIITDEDWTGAVVNKNSTVEGSDQAHDNMPPYLVGNWLIKT